MKKSNRRAALLCLTAMLTLGGCGKAVSESQEPPESSRDAEETVEIKNGQVLYEDRVYTYNTHLLNYLFLGVDRDELADTTVGQADGGQTDAIFLLSRDRVTGDVDLITIPRDTMTMINVYGQGGTDLGPVRQHISLAYGYGDGRHESCRMTRSAVSALFYEIPIQSYCAVTLDALETVSDALGPVTVTVPNDSLVQKAPEMKAGSEVQIDSSNIELFVRYRDTGEDHSALYRSERQNAYLKACFEQIQKRFEENPQIILDLYEAVEPYMVTGMQNTQFYEIMEGLSDGGELTQWTVPGEGVTTDGFDEYHVDEEAFYEQILAGFFETDL